MGIEKSNLAAESSDRKGYFCYMVRCADDTLYTGITTDLPRRVKQHNSGKGAAYTRQHGPVTLVYAEPQPDRGTATKRELQLKRYPRSKKLQLISDLPADAIDNLIAGISPSISNDA